MQAALQYTREPCVSSTRAQPASGGAALAASRVSLAETGVSKASNACSVRPLVSLIRVRPRGRFFTFPCIRRFGSCQTAGS